MDHCIRLCIWLSTTENRLFCTVYCSQRQTTVPCFSLSFAAHLAFPDCLSFRRRRSLNFLSRLPRSLLGGNPLLEVGRFRRRCRARRENKNKGNDKGRIYEGADTSTVNHLLFLKHFIIAGKVSKNQQTIVFLCFRLIKKGLPCQQKLYWKIRQFSGKVP